MMKRVLNFVKYNNAFTIVFVLCFFSFGVSYAASPAVRDSVYSSEETVVSIDNRSIVSTDLDSYNFNLIINSITEDDKHFYAAYSYQTLSLVDSIWQNKSQEKTLTVSKESLGDKDLGLYLAKELGDNINYELSYLKRVQVLEREKGESVKVVNIAYSGLIGKLLNPREKVIEGYNPVIPETVAVVEPNPDTAAVLAPFVRPDKDPKPKQIVLVIPTNDNAASTTVSVASTGDVATSASEATSTTEITTEATSTTVDNPLPDNSPASSTPSVITEPVAIPVVTPEPVVEQPRETSTPPAPVPPAETNPASTP
jgi:hypothetical protein